MSNKSYNRGTEVIRRDVDHKINKADEVRAGRILDRMNADMERLEKENQSLKAELERARSAYHRRNAELGVLKEELCAQQEANKSQHEAYISCFKALCDERKGHQKLTAVMRLALTPEQYHEARANAAEAYPELFRVLA